MKTIGTITEVMGAVIPNGKSVVMYIYADAFTFCDCGKDLMLSQNTFGDNTYRGACSCGLRWELLNGKLSNHPPHSL